MLDLNTQSNLSAAAVLTTTLALTSGVAQAFEHVSVTESSQETVTIEEVQNLLSIEYQRQTVRRELGDLFGFDSPDKEVNFIADSENDGLRKVLPAVGKFLRYSFGERALMTLELLDEGDDWKTLFINVDFPVSISFEEANNIYDIIIHAVREYDRSLANKLNIDLIPNASV